MEDVMQNNEDRSSLPTSRIELLLPKFLVAAGIAIFCAQAAYAVPSYSRQTGLSCGSCHYAPPELNAFGRKFKLEGYTFATKPEVSEDKKDHRHKALIGSHGCS